MAWSLKLKSSRVLASAASVTRDFPRAVFHAECPLTRSAPAGMLALSELAGKSGYKVVLSGEGADEFFLGYDIYREAKAREFLSRDTGSKIRGELVAGLYPYLERGRPGAGAYMKGYFMKGVTGTGSFFYSHQPRWALSGRIKRCYSAGVKKELAGYDCLKGLAASLPPGYRRWGVIERAQYLESSILLGRYLLSSQDDRQAMAHGVETRFPFLDHRLVEFALSIPAHVNMRGLAGKRILKKAFRKALPDAILDRPKTPYRAPALRSGYAAGWPDELRESLGPRAVKECGVFDPKPVSTLIKKLGSSKLAPSEADSAALAGIASTHLLYRQFVKAG